MLSIRRRTSICFENNFRSPISLLMLKRNKKFEGLLQNFWDLKYERTRVYNSSSCQNMRTPTYQQGHNTHFQICDELLLETVLQFRTVAKTLTY